MVDVDGNHLYTDKGYDIALEKAYEMIEDIFIIYPGVEWVEIINEELKEQEYYNMYANEKINYFIMY